MREKIMCTAFINQYP